MKSWTVTDTGPYGEHRYFIRLSPTGDPNAAETYNLNNGSLNNVDQRSVVDAGFLELTRLGELSPRDSDIAASLKVVDSILERQTPSGPGWHRYGLQANGSTDGYGDCYEPDPTDCSPSGAPSYDGMGPVTCGRSSTASAPSRSCSPATRAGAESLATSMEHMSWGVGLMPEQVWEDPDIPGRAVRRESGHRLDRIRRRQGRGLGDAADLGRRPVRATDP